MRNSIIAIFLSIFLILGGSAGYMSMAKPRVDFSLIQDSGMGPTESNNDILFQIQFEITEMIGATDSSMIPIDILTFTVNSPSGTSECK